MLLATIPSYDFDKDKDKEEDVIEAATASAIFKIFK